MNSTTRNILIVGGVAIVLLCLCLSALLIGGYILLKPVQRVSTGDSPRQNITQEAILPKPSSTAEPLLPTPTTEPTDRQDTTPAPVTTPEATPASPSARLPANVARQMDEIQRQVSELRGLQPLHEVRRALLTPDQLRQRVTEDFFKDYTDDEARQDAIVLAAFGLLETNFDLNDFYVELYSEQVAGFYDEDTDEMYIVQGEGFGGLERLTYAHEYNHALQDQTYDLNSLGMENEDCEQDSERCAAVQAFIEGEASLVEMEWFFANGSPQDLADLQSTDFNFPVFESAPPFMKQDFLFPYSQGQAFVEYLKEEGGWPAVDAAYADLPVSTEQILHPERYPADKPIPVDLPDLIAALGDGWEEYDRGVMGEWYSYLILAHGFDPRTWIDDDQAKEAAEGWGGDAYVVYFNERTQSTTLVMKSLWESRSEAGEFNAAFRDYASFRFGDPTADRANLATWESAQGYTEFHFEGDTTIWILAPDAVTAAQVWEILR